MILAKPGDKIKIIRPPDQRHVWYANYVGSIMTVIRSVSWEIEQYEVEVPKELRYQQVYVDISDTEFVCESVINQMKKEIKK